jgi:hypothetical protein
MIGRAPIVLFSVVILLLAAASFARNGIYHEDLRLWQDVVEKSPAKARPRYQLGLL